MVTVPKHEGARWVRAALQVNPFDYAGIQSPRKRFPDEETYNAAIVAACEASGIELVAITDHWAISTAARLTESLEEAGIAVLPGFEANSREGVHLLVLFERGTEVAAVTAAIGTCGGSPGHRGSGRVTFEDILTRMAEIDALVIPPHCNVGTGLLGRATGDPLQQMVTHPHLHAIGISPDLPEAPSQADVTAGTGAYARRHPLAVIHADDVSHPDVLARPGGSTWFKISTPSLQSLTVAVKAPATRVQRHDPAATPRALIRQVSWTGGFLDQVTIPLADDLTALIGGRGTGKSTALESIRFALDITPLGADARRDHENLVRGVLGAGAVVTLDVSVPLPSPTRYSIRRTVNSPPVVLDMHGADTGLSPADALGPVEMFGQHELAELAHDPEAVAEMLERFAGRSATDADIVRIQAALRENRAALRSLEEQLAEYDADADDLPRLEARVQRYKDSDVATRLDSRQRLTTADSLFDTARTALSRAGDELAGMRLQQAVQRLRSAGHPAPDVPHREILDKLPTILDQAADEIGRALEAARGAAAAAETAVDAVDEQWQTATGAERNAHDAVLRDLEAGGDKPTDYLTAAQELEAARRKQGDRRPIAEQRDALLAARRTLLGQLGTREHELLQAFHDSVRQANSATAGRVVVRPAASRNHEQAATIIRSHVRYVAAIRSALERDDFTPRALARAIRAGEAALEADFQIRGAAATQLAAAGEPLARELEELTVRQAVAVQLDVSATRNRREYRALNDLSRGQRATALLLLLLGASRDPLIIDQPEDDLDNRFVFDGVVHHLRDLKGRRQVIVSTHNANVPVLGDAELIVALESDGSTAGPSVGGIGSLDTPRVRQLVEEILEGGREAFEARQHLYGF